MSGGPRIAGAPITWGVCEVPGWGHQMSAERVFAEMAGLGLAATEAGPAGFLPDDPLKARALLDQLGLALVGGFVPAVLHTDADPLPTVERAARWLADAGAGVLVLAADTAGHGYDTGAELDAGEWARLLAACDRVTELAAERGLLAVLHPHVGTAVERRSAVERVLDGSRIPLCLDTGHQLIGGIDPVRLARDAADRIRHVQLKDVDSRLAADVRAGALTYHDAVTRGLYRPLGHGDVDVAAVTAVLGAAGFDGWYVLEQDVVLAGEPPAGNGPVADARRSLQYLQSVLAPSRRK